MKIEQIEKDKIQVTFSKEDLDNNKINFHNLMCNSKMTQNLFLVVLDIAEKEMGFETTNYEIAIETLVLDNTDFILTISRKKPFENALHKNLKITRKSFDFDNVFKFNSFDDFYDFYNKIKFSVQFKKSLFYFNNNFYYINNELKYTQNSKSILLEYAKPTQLPRFFNKKLWSSSSLIPRPFGSLNSVPLVLFLLSKKDANNYRIFFT